MALLKTRFLTGLAGSSVEGRAHCPQRAGLHSARCGGALDTYIRKPVMFEKNFEVSPERGHSCPQQLPDAQRNWNVQELRLRATVLRTRMSALRFGSCPGALRT